MKLNEPQDSSAWIALTLVEEKAFARSVIQYWARQDFESVPAWKMIEHRTSGGVIDANDFVALMGRIQKTTIGVPSEIRWDGTCEELIRSDEALLALDRIWIWKAVWENWTQHHLDEFPGNETLFKKDEARFVDFEIKRAEGYEERYWEAVAQYEQEPNGSTTVAIERANDSHKRGAMVIASCLMDVWNIYLEEIGA